LSIIAGEPHYLAVQIRVHQCWYIAPSAISRRLDLFPQAPQYFVAIVPQVEVVQPAWLGVQNCQFDEGDKIKLRPLGIQAVEEFAPALLAGAIETSEEVLSKLLARAFGLSATSSRPFLTRFCFLRVVLGRIPLFPVTVGLAAAVALRGCSKGRPARFRAPCPR
jgi:hypothetical protein